MQAKFGVTGPQRLVLRIVGTFPGLSAGDLARTLHVHPSTLTGILQRLEARRLLRRLTDPSDARRVQLEITARGKRLTVPSVGTVESAIKRLMSTWTDSELNVTRRTLTAIAEELDGSPTGNSHAALCIQVAPQTTPNFPTPNSQTFLSSGSCWELEVGSLGVRKSYLGLNGCLAVFAPARTSLTVGLPPSARAIDSFVAW